jgi:hypothetical protein
VNHSVQKLLMASWLGIVLPLQVPLFGMDELRQSARSLGAAGAYAPIADDLSAFYLNPAGLSRNSESRIFAMGATALENTKDNFGLRAALIDGKTEDPLHWGFLFNMAQTESRRFYDYILASSYSYQGFLMIGIQNRISSFELPTDKTVFSVSVGALALLGENLTLSVSGSNLYRTQTDQADLPLSFGGGGSLNLETIRFAFNFERLHEPNKTYGSFAAEILLSENMMARGGYLSDIHAADRAWSAGLSLMPTEGSSLDVGYLHYLNADFFVLNTGVTIRFD